MAKKYPDELKQRAKDYVQVHGYTLEKVSEILEIPITTINGWSNADVDGKWIKSKYKDKIEDIKDELRKVTHDHPIYQTVKQQLLAEIIAQSPNQLALTVEEKVIAENRADALIMEAMSIENFDLMALEGVQLANKKLRYLKTETDMRKVPMSEIKIYNDIVASVKNQIHGKAPDTIINIATQNNLAQQVDYSQMSQDELMKELAKIEAKEKLEKAM